jgi:hypothetical protein
MAQAGIWADPDDVSDFDEDVVLGLLIGHAPAHFLSTDELAQALGGEATATRTEDALAGLERAGLAHRLDRFAWPTRAALRSDELTPI